MAILYIDGRASFEQRGDHVLATLPSGDGEPVQLLLTRHALRYLGRRAQVADADWQDEGEPASIVPLRKQGRR